MPRVDKPIVRPLQNKEEEPKQGLMTLRELRWSLAQDVDAGIISKERAMEIELEYLDPDLKTLIVGLVDQIEKGTLKIDVALRIAEGYLDTKKDLWTEEDERDFLINNKGAM